MMLQKIMTLPNANQYPSVTEPTSTPTAIFLKQHVNLPKVHCHSILLLLSAAEKNICFVLTDVTVSLRAFFSATKTPV